MPGRRAGLVAAAAALAPVTLANEVQASALRRECVQFLQDYEFTSRPDAYNEGSLALYQACLGQLRTHVPRRTRTLVGGLHHPTMVTLHGGGPPVLAQHIVEAAQCEQQEHGYLHRCCTGGNAGEGAAGAGGPGQECWGGDGARKARCCAPTPGPAFIFITPALDVNVGSRMRSQGTFVVQQSYALQSLCGPGDVIVDAGANIGAYTVPLAAHVGHTGAVYAFEPFRKLFQLLCANAAANGLGNVHAVHAALGGTEERLRVRSPDLSTFNLPSSMQVRNQGYSQAERNWTLYYEPDALEDVVVMTLDSLRLPALKLLKVDVEDMEVEVVAGARDTLRRLRPWVWAENARLFEHGDRAFVEALEALGYACEPVAGMDWELLCGFNG